MKGERGREKKKEEKKKEKRREEKRKRKERKKKREKTNQGARHERPSPHGGGTLHAVASTESHLWAWGGEHRSSQDTKPLWLGGLGGQNRGAVFFWDFGFFLDFFWPRRFSGSFFFISFSLLNYDIFFKCFCFGFFVFYFCWNYSLVISLGFPILLLFEFLV